MNHDAVRVEREALLASEIRKLLNADALETIVRTARVDAGPDLRRSILEGHGFRITKGIASALSSICDEVKKSLGFEEPLECFVVDDASLNCRVYPRLTEDHCHIVVIHSALLQRLDDSELRFVLGHELGHLLSRNAELWRLLSFVFPDPSLIPLVLQNKIRVWRQLSELSADRFGLLAAPDFDSCVTALFKISSGLAPQRIDFQIDRYIEEMEESLEYLRTAGANSNGTHPMYPLRVLALRAFQSSELLRALGSGRSASGDDALSSRMRDLVDILIRAGVSERDRLLQRYIASAGLVMAQVDGNITRAEVDQILRSLAGVTLFPEPVLSQMLEADDAEQVFRDSAFTILESYPEERDRMFSYLGQMLLADRRIGAEEIEILMRLGTQLFGFTPQGCAARLGAQVQEDFRPWMVSS